MSRSPTPEALTRRAPQDAPPSRRSAPGRAKGAGAASPALRMSEAALQSAIVELAGWLGYDLISHAWLSVRSAPGLPDLLLLNPTLGRMVVFEVKSATGKVTPAQQRWLDGFRACGVEARVVRPADWHDGTVEAVLKGEN